MTGVRAVLAAVVLAGAAVAMGCLDALAPGGPRVVNLSLVPVFEGMAPQDGIPSDVDSIVVTIRDTTRTPPFFATIGRRIPPGQDSITIELEVVVVGTQDTVKVSFSAYRSSDGALLYTDTVDVTVRVGLPTPPVPVTADYVGPGQNIRSISISPPSASIKPGDTLTFTASAVDSSGVAIPTSGAGSMPVLFDSRNDDVVRIDAAGLARGVAEGETFVVVTSGARASVKDSARVTVSRTAPPVAALALAPGFSVMRPTDTLRLQVTATDANGNPVQPTGLGFTSRNSGVATVGGTTGLVTAVGGGTAVIVASAGTATDSMLVAVAGSGVAVAAATTGGAAFASARVGDTVKVLVAVDMRGSGTERLGSYNAQLDWTAANLRYVRAGAVSGGFAAPTLNETATTSGSLRFGAIDANGATGTIGLVEVVFVGLAAGRSPLTLTLTDLSAARTFTNLLPAALVLPGSVTIR